MDGRTDVCTDGHMDGRMDRRTDGQTDGRMDRQTDGQTDGRTDRRMYRQTDVRNGPAYVSRGEGFTHFGADAQKRIQVWFFENLQFC